MQAHAAGSTHFQVGGGNHDVTPAVFGVVASWVQNLLRKDLVRPSYTTVV
jgi:hypothetical protein